MNVAEFAGLIAAVPVVVYNVRIAATSSTRPRGRFANSAEDADPSPPVPCTSISTRSGSDVVPRLPVSTIRTRPSCSRVCSSEW